MQVLGGCTGLLGDPSFVGQEHWHLQSCLQVQLQAVLARSLNAAVVVVAAAFLQAKVANLCHSLHVPAHAQFACPKLALLQTRIDVFEHMHLRIALHDSDRQCKRCNVDSISNDGLFTMIRASW